MINDKDTNLVYFSELLLTDSKYSGTCNQITAILDFCGIKYDFLQETKDIWVRDFMPIQISDNQFIEYKYYPDYLKINKYRNTRSFPDKICETINLKTLKTNIILDGGNIIKSSDCIILTDKIFIENKISYSAEELLVELKHVFAVDKIVIIPWDKSEIFGHADGMIRFIDDNTVLLNGYFKYYPAKFKQHLYGSLQQNGLIWKELNYKVVKEDKRNWSYINFLQTKDLILIPKFGIDEDKQALEQIKEYFPSYSNINRVHQVGMSEIVKEGGALNCITWSIKP